MMSRQVKRQIAPVFSETLAPGPRAIGPISVFKDTAPLANQTPSWFAWNRILQRVPTVMADDAELRDLEAIARYKEGRCPECDRRLGDARGLEYRRWSGDIYCHTCKKSWPVETDPGGLNDEIRRLRVEAARTDCSHRPGVAVPQMDIARKKMAMSGVRRLFKKIRIRH